MPTRGRPRNPLHQTPRRFHRLSYVATVRAGETPGTMETDLRAKEQAGGTIRRLWQQAVHPTPAPPPFEVSAQPATITRAVRYKTSSVYLAAGSDNTRFRRLHSIRRPLVRQPVPTLSAGVRRNPPTIRNRMVSFGNRVPPLNRRSRAASTA